MHKTAVVLFNLGGPDRPEAIRPFLFNLFNDPAIIRLPWLLRRLIAGVVSRKRAVVAAGIYEKLGGRSPIVPETEAQAAALEKALAEKSDGYYRCFICMRYWHPMADEVARAVKDWGAERVMLLPLYPQFSTTTTASSFTAWHRAAQRAQLAAPTAIVGCYPTAPGFVAAQAALVRAAIAKLPADQPWRLLFSAHGLPKKIVKGGDPYQWQVEQSAAAVAQELAIPGLDWQVCYQSRVGPLEWIGPSTEAEIARAGTDGKAVVLAPIAFVSEHSETLVELDIEYAHLAAEQRVPAYIRVPTVGVQPEFIAGLAALVRQAAYDGQARCAAGRRQCPQGFRGCICAA